MSISLMTECKKFDASTQTDCDIAQREIEALGIELEAGIISQEHHDEMVLTLQDDIAIDIAELKTQQRKRDSGRSYK